MNNRSKLKEMGRQQIMAAIVECTEKLGEVPSQPQLTKMTNVTKLQVRKHFGSYAHALRACNLEKAGAGWKIPIEALFQDWAMVVRALGKLPSAAANTSRQANTARRRWRSGLEHGARCRMV